MLAQTLYRSCFQLPNIPISHLCNEAFVVMLLRLQAFLSKENRMEVVYEVLLPHLISFEEVEDVTAPGGRSVRDALWTKSLAELVVSSDQPPMTSGQRSGTCFYRSALLAIKFFLWRRGFSHADTKRFMVLLRLEYARCAVADLRTDVPLLEWEREVLNLACKQVARATLKAQAAPGGLPDAASAVIKDALSAIRERSVLVADVMSTSAAHQDLAVDTPVTAAAIPFFEHLAGLTSSEAFAGTAATSVDKPVVDLSPVVLDGPLTLDGILVMLKRAVLQCETFRARAHFSNASLAMHFICNVVETLFLKELPCPLPASDAAPATQSPWHMAAPAFSSDCQSSVLLQLHLLMVAYVTAVQSLPNFASFHARRIVTSATILACFDAVVRIPAPEAGAALAVSNVLTGRSSRETPAELKYPVRKWCISSRSFAGLSIADRTEGCLLLDPLVAQRRDVVCQYWDAAENAVAVPAADGSPSGRQLFTFDTGVRFTAQSDVIEFTGSLMEELEVDGIPRDIYLDATAQLHSNVGAMEALSTLERLGMWYVSLWENAPEFPQLRTMVVLHKVLMERPRSRMCIPLKYWQTYQALPYFRYTAKNCSSEQLVIDIRVFSGFLGVGYELNFEPRCVALRAVAFPGRCSIEPCLIMVRVSCVCSAMGQPYIPLASKAHPGLWIVSDEEVDPAVLMGLIPSDTLCDLDENKVVTSKLETLKGALSAEDAQALVSILCAPYVRIPLLLDLLSQERMLSALYTEKVRGVLEAALFEPLAYSRAVWTGDENGDWTAPLPAEHRRVGLSTRYGLLVNELVHNPAAVVDPVLKLVRMARQVTAGGYSANFASLFLFTVRILVRLGQFVKFSRTLPELSAAVVDALEVASAALSSEVVLCRERILHVANRCDDSDDIVAASQCHAHYVMTFIPEERVAEGDIAQLLSSVSFFMSWYTPRHGQGCLDINEVIVTFDEMGRPDEYDEDDDVPVVEVLQVLQAFRPLVQSTLMGLSPGARDAQLSRILAASMRQVCSFLVLCVIVLETPSVYHVTMQSRLLKSSDWKPSEPDVMCHATFETPHPYDPGLELYQVIHFPGAPYIRVTFNNLTHTEYGNDSITFYKGERGCRHLRCCLTANVAKHFRYVCMLTGPQMTRVWSVGVDPVTAASSVGRARGAPSR